ncbi:MAG: hypothetical protein V8S14_02840 [Lachnospiraceae bacterium]
MDSKINVLGIYIDLLHGKEAMKEAVGYMESDPVNIVELLTVDAVMDVELQQERRNKLEFWILCWQETRQFWKQWMWKRSVVCRRQRIIYL